MFRYGAAVGEGTVHAEQLVATDTVEVTAVGGYTTSVSRVFATVLGSAPPSTATIVNVRYTLP